MKAIIMKLKALTPFTIYMAIVIAILLICLMLSALQKFVLDAQGLMLTPIIFNCALVLACISFFLLVVSLLIKALQWILHKEYKKKWLEIILFPICLTLSFILSGFVGLYLLLIFVFGFQNAELVELSSNANASTPKIYYKIDYSFLDPVYEYHLYINPLLMEKEYIDSHVALEEES